MQKALDLLGAALDAALGLLEKGLLFAVDVYAKAVQGAIKFAEVVYNALAVFAVLIDHIAPDPLRWLSNLGASAKDGVRNHLWTAFKKAVKRWFNEKLEEVLGLGLTVWNLLKKGGISIARIGTMVWEGLKAAIPPTLIQLIIEKLVAMIIPAAGAIMMIIEGLRAAWGTVRRDPRGVRAVLQVLEGGQDRPSRRAVRGGGRRGRNRRHRLRRQLAADAAQKACRRAERSAFGRWRRSSTTGLAR